MSRLGAVSLLSLSLVAASAMIPAAASPGATPNGSAGGAYVALGDSFTSGQGVSPWVDENCYVSEASSYPSISAKKSRYREALNVACSGAKTSDILGQIISIPLEVRDNASVVTLTVGGNDVLSDVVLAACSVAPASPECGAAIAQAGDNLGTVGPKLIATYTAVAAAFPKARIYVLNYPLLFDGNFTSPLVGTVNGATDSLNQIIAGMVVLTGNPRVLPVDITGAFANRGIGGSLPSYISFDPTNPFDARNFHPNALGNAAYADALRAAGAIRGR